MTSPNPASATPRKSLTLLQFLALIAFAGLAASILLKLYI